MWADANPHTVSPSKVVDARSENAPNLTPKHVILSEDGTKIRKDAETAIRNEQKIAEQRSGTKFFRGKNGEILGFTKNGKIYLDPRIATSETAVHEFSHLWSDALEKANPQAWEQLKDQLRNDKELLDYVKSLYPEITDENELMHEVFSHFSGKRGRARLEELRKAETAKADGVLGKARVVAMFHRLGELLKRFWQKSRDLFAGKVEGIEKLSAEDFADMALADLLHKMNPAKEAKVNPDMRYQKARNGINVPEEEFAVIAHQIATYPDKIERGHVFTANKYYLCTDIDEDGNFRIVATLPIEGNEDLINEIRKHGESVIAIRPTESTDRIIGDIRRRGGRVSRNYARSKGQRG